MDADESKPLPPCPYCGTPGPQSLATGSNWVVTCVGCPGRIIGRTRLGAESTWRAHATDDDLRRR